MRVSAKFGIPAASTIKFCLSFSLVGLLQLRSYTIAENTSKHKRYAVFVLITYTAVQKTKTVLVDGGCKKSRLNLKRLLVINAQNKDEFFVFTYAHS